MDDVDKQSMASILQTLKEKNAAHPECSDQDSPQLAFNDEIPSIWIQPPVSPYKLPAFDLDQNIKTPQ